VTYYDVSFDSIQLRCDC